MRARSLVWVFFLLVVCTSKGSRTRVDGGNADSPPDQALVIAAGAAYTNTTAVALTLSSLNAIDMYITNTAACEADGTWETFATSKDWTLEQTNGTATVYAKFRTSTGDESECYSSTIIHDSVIPVGPATFNDGKIDYSTTTSPVLKWDAATDTGSGIDHYEIALGTKSGGVDVQDFKTVGDVLTYQVKSVKLTNGTMYFASLRAVDKAGNNGNTLNGDGFTAYTSPGSLDLDFGKEGVYTSDNAAGGSGSDYAYDGVQQSDGKLVIVGSSANSQGFQDMTVWRLTAAGALDETFGTKGIFRHAGAAGGSGDDVGRAVLVQSDGTIVIAGYSAGSLNRDMAIWRLTAAGKLDDTFNTTGYFTHNGAAGGTGEDAVYSMVQQSDGKFVLAGVSKGLADADVAVWRITTKGALDTDFNTKGYYTRTGIGGGSGADIGAQVTVRTDGTILIAGQTQGVSRQQLFVLQMTPTGNPDNAFGSGGIMTSSDTLGDRGGTGIAINADNRPLVGGYFGNGKTTDLGVLRLSSVGVIDPNFGSAGIYTDGGVVRSGSHYANGLALQDDGKVLLVGYDQSSLNVKTLLVTRVGADGTIDTSFGSTGIYTYSPGISTDAFGQRAFIAADGGIIIVGVVSNGRNYDAAVWRLK